jgi:hypothetical protein
VFGIAAHRVSYSQPIFDQVHQLFLIQYTERAVHSSYDHKLADDHAESQRSSCLSPPRCVRWPVRSLPLQAACAPP